MNPFMHRDRRTMPIHAALAALLIVSAGCSSDDDDDVSDADDGDDIGDADDGDDVSDDGSDDGDGDAPAYREASLPPLFDLPSSADQSRFEVAGESLSSADFTSDAAGVTIEQKLAQLEQRLTLENARGPVRLIEPQDNELAAGMPFRGHPSDVDLLALDGERFAFVPLGGSVGVPGDEVAAVELSSGTVSLIQVGVRPLRAAAHPAGLVFVCNQDSNYISIIDAWSLQELQVVEVPVRLPTEFSCSDVLLAPIVAGDELGDVVDLFVANQRLATVERHRVTILRSGETGLPADVIYNDAPPGPAQVITGVGRYPQRLRLTRDRGSVLVSSGRTGDLARFNLPGGTPDLIEVGGPALDAIELADSVLVATTTRDRGLLSRDEDAPAAVQADPILVEGLDGEPSEAHPGAQLDGTHAYGFEDVRNGLLQLDQDLGTEVLYYTDDVSRETSFSPEQKVLAGALPVAIESDGGGGRVFVALSGSAAVQEMAVGEGGRLEAIEGGDFATGSRPFALAVDEDAGELLVASWGGEVLEVFDLETRALIDAIELDYANPEYPATTLEAGEELFYSADWSNNGRKACASCHVDELSTDGLGFSIGTTAPTALHQIRPLANLLYTDGYAWNGLTRGSGLGALELRAQIRTNCELIAFGLAEGPGSDPGTRIGDPANYSGGNAAACRPDPVDPATGLPSNFDEIAAEIVNQQVAVASIIEDVTGRPLEDVRRAITWYLASQLRLPANPVAFQAEGGDLSSDEAERLVIGGQVFQKAGCATCHDPSASAGFTDLAEHGPGAGWIDELLERYIDDGRFDVFRLGPDSSIEGPDQVVHQSIDQLIPFCFDEESCLVIADPIQAADEAEEDKRLALIRRFSLPELEEGFLPGNVVGRVLVNTPSLRGVWSNPALLHNAAARSIREAILPPGHPALRDGERGLAVATDESIDVHGTTSTLSVDEVDVLVDYVESIE